MGLERTGAAAIAAASHFSADEDGEAALRRLLADMLGEIELEGGEPPICRRGIVCRLPGLAVATCILAPGPTALRRPASSPEPHLLMVRSMDGPLVVAQGGRAASAAPGELVFLDAACPFEWHLPEGGRIDCARLPQSALRLSARRLAQTLLRPIPRDFPPLLLLVTYGAYLLMRSPLSAAEAELALAHFRELLPLVAAHLDAPSASGAALRLERVKAEIESRLSQPDLSAAEIAALHGVTPRYLQRLFQGEGTTFSRFVLDRRLAAALRMIEQPDERQTISAVAYAVGFGDLSYFNRAFRRRYGVPPSALTSGRRRSASAPPAR
ncbi:transcriptional activator RhrA [Allostella sp. ATCC 35155]|nr:transcriptional activator RhrA [Stella sp. ATCC 35155]